MFNAYTVDYPIFKASKCGEKTKLESLSKAINNHSLCYIDYCRSQLFNNPFLQNTFLYFWPEKDTLHLLGTGITLRYINGICKNISDYKHLISSIYQIPVEFIEDLFYAIYTYLSSCHFSTYHTALMNLKKEMFCFNIPFLEKISSFWLLDDILCYSRDNQNYEMVSQKWFESQFSSIECPKTDLPVKQLQDVYLSLKAEVLSNQVIQTAQKNCLYYLDSSYQPISAHYIQTSRQVIVERDTRNDILPSRRIYLDSPIRSIPITESLNDFLYYLSSGNPDTLNLIAELCTRIMSETLPSKYVWILSGSRSVIEYFLNILQELTKSYPCEGAYSKEKQIFSEKIIEAGLNRVFYQYNYSPHESFNELTHLRIQKLIQGETVTSYSDAIVSLETSSNTVLIYATDKDSSSIKEEMKKLSYRSLPLSDQILNCKLSANDFDWLRTVFVFYGLDMMNGGSPQCKKTAYIDYTVEQLIKDFARKFCSKNSGTAIKTRIFIIISKNITSHSLLPFSYLVLQNCIPLYVIS